MVLRNGIEKLTAFQKLAEYFGDHGLFPDGTAISKKILLNLYRMVAEGKPVQKQALASRLHLDVLEVTKVLDRLPPSNIVYNAAGDITGYRGLGQEKNRHQLLAGETRLYAWCAFDCLFLPELLQCKLEVTSSCPETGQEIKLTLSPDAIVETQPNNIFVSFVTPDMNAYKDDLQGNFCCHVNFFSSEEAGKAWTIRNDGTVLLPLEEAFALAHIRNKSGFGPALN